MKHLHLHNFLLLLLLTSPVTYADITPTKTEYSENITNTFSNFSTHISIKNVSGEANEYVYFPRENRTTSQLIWNIDSLQMLNLGLKMDFEVIKLNADLAFNLSDGDSYLLDYDWAVRNSDWTDKSEHPDTTVTEANIFEISAEIETFYLNEETVLSLLLGYRYESYTWQARGGSFIYSIDNFRDTRATFKDGLLGVTYEQVWNTPYIGIKIDSKFNDITLHTQLHYSPYANGEMTDLHYLRNLKTIDTFDKTTMLGINIGLNYDLSPKVTVGADYSYLHYKNSTGDIQWYENGQVDYLTNYAGADLKTSMFSVSLAYTF